MSLVLLILISLTIYNCNSRCEIINSIKKGKLIISRSEKPNSICIGNMIFRSKKNGEEFCLNKKRRDKDLAKLTCNGCLCGEENKPDLKWTEENNPDLKWTEENKPDLKWTEENKPHLKWTEENKPASQWTQENKPDRRWNVEPNKTQKIVGGQYTGENQYPWYAMLFLMISTLDINSTHTGGHLRCGGSLITEKVVLSAAHCVDDWERNASDYLIGLGMHNISGFKDWTWGDFSKHSIMEVDEIIIHEEYFISGSFDFALLTLKQPARFSFKVSPVCLPKKEEIDILERENNIVIGFGTSHIWFIEYNKLLGGKLKTASLITPDLISNKSALIWGFTEGNLEKDMIDGYFKTFIEIFPGIEICIENYEFVCNMTEDTMKTIIRNMEIKIRNSGSRIENYNVKAFLEATHKRILEIYAEYINKWKTLFYIPVDEKLKKGTYWLKYLDLKKEEVVKIRSSIKFVNQWVFIEATERIVISGLQHANILKMAKGKFVPWSEAEKWKEEDPSLKWDENPSTILVQRSDMKDGYACQGDSGGPLVVKRNGRFVLVASVHKGPAIHMIFSWPPPCYCSCGMVPEVHMRVSSALPWIYEHLKERNLQIPCQR